MARKDGVYQQHGPRDLWDADYGQDVAALPSMAAMDPDQTGPAAATAASSALVSPSPQADGTSLSPTADGVAMLQFITGLDGSGKLDVTDPNYWNWDGNNPATFKDNFGGLAHVWDNSKAVTYWFNPASNWSAAEQASFTSALNFWSAVSNIQFTLSNAVSQPSNAYVITRGSDGQAFTNANYSFDFTLLKGKTISATTSIDTNVNGWTALGSFSVTGGYGPQTVLHETATALGLGRPGPYTATLAASQVIFTADTRQYTVMSYVDPGSAIANSVATKNGDTPSPANYNGHYLTTPGQYDILAMQRLYGAPAASTPLTVGETFGFNASAILKSSLPAFDFTVNTNPVVTIYDSGTGNSW